MKKWGGAGVILRDAVIVSVLAGTTFQALRQWVGDRYVVPTDSMQPTLYGDPARGDVVFVNKLAQAADLRRYDMAVFRAPDDTGDLIKRVVAFGDDPNACWIECLEGDLWVGPRAQQMERLVKDPLATRDLRVAWLRWPARGQMPVRDPAEFESLLAGVELGDDGAMLLPSGLHVASVRAAALRREPGVGSMAATPDGWLSTTRAVDASYLDALGVRGQANSDLLVTDVGVDLDLRLDGATDFFCGFDLRPDAWLVHLDIARQTIALWCNGKTIAESKFDLDAAGAGAQETVRIECGHLDGRFFFALDGREDRSWCIERKADWQTVDPGPTAWSMQKNGIYLGATAPRPLSVVRFEIFRDVHWFRPPLEIDNSPNRFVGAKFVRPGHVYLLGDNSVSSRDSRLFGDVALDGFIGRPVLILGPVHRLRWLPR